MKINVIGTGLYGKHIYEMLISTYPRIEINNFSVEDVFHIGKQDIFILAIRPDKAKEMCAGMLKDCIVVDVTPAHRGDSDFQYVDVLFDGELEGDKFTMGGCMASAIKCLFNHTGKLRHVNVEIGQSVTGKLTHTRDVQYGLSSQSQEAGIDFFPKLRHECLSGIHVIANSVTVSDVPFKKYINDSVRDEYQLQYDFFSDEIHLIANNFKLLDYPLQVVVEHLIMRNENVEGFHDSK